MGGVQSSSVVGSFAPATARTFDVAKEHDLLTLLNFIRRGPFEPVAKNNLRDLVLDFSALGDVAALAGLGKELSGAGVVLLRDGLPLTTRVPDASKINAGEETPAAHLVVTAESEAKPADSPAFGSARPMPAFASKEATKGVAQQESVPTEPIATNPERSITQPMETEVHSQPETEVPTVVSEMQPLPDVPQEILQAAPKKIEVASVSSSSATAQPSPATKEIYVERIKEIKKQVNERVGNPVNLIDVNNAVGREYMNALLNAMRVIAGENEVEIKIAMERLEKAYASVETSLEGSSNEITKSATPNAVTEASRHTLVADETGSTAPQPTEGWQGTETARVREEVEPVAVPGENKQTLDTSVDVPIGPIPKPITAVPTPPKTSMQRLAEEVRLKEPTPKPPEAQKTITATGQVEGPVSLAEKIRHERATQDALLQERAAEHQAAEQSKHEGDPLFVDEVNKGLNQLLSEWKLFKSSGIFGTGPGGSEHPLYKQLAKLPMAAVVAGRYEGSTSQVKQSITDYMNGWRYEQGVVHEMGETFEHYLRRVIRHILDKRPTPPVQ